MYVVIVGIKTILTTSNKNEAELVYKILKYEHRHSGNQVQILDYSDGKYESAIDYFTNYSNRLELKYMCDDRKVKTGDMLPFLIDDEVVLKKISHVCQYSNIIIIDEEYYAIHDIMNKIEESFS